MDNLDKYLPLLIVVVSFVVSIINSIKKKQKEQELPKPVPPVKRKPTFPNKDEKKRTIVFPEDNEIDFPLETVEVVAPAKRSKSIPASASIVHRQESLLEEESASELNVDLQNIEEVRKAIIYSEILTKRYE